MQPELMFPIMGISFATAIVVGMGWVRLKHPKKASPISEGSLVKLKGLSGQFRTRFVGTMNGYWVVESPLRLDSHVPMHAGETFILEVPDQQGAWLYRTKVLELDRESHRVQLEPAAEGIHVERRVEKRHRLPDRPEIKLNGSKGRLVDVSRSGARMETSLPLKKGDVVRLDLPYDKGSTSAIVLEMEYSEESASVMLARVVFEEPIEWF